MQLGGDGEVRGGAEELRGGLSFGDLSIGVGGDRGDAEGLAGALGVVGGQDGSVDMDEGLALLRLLAIVVAIAEYPYAPSSSHVSTDEGSL